MRLDKVDVACLQVLNGEVDPILLGDLWDKINDGKIFRVTSGLMNDSFEKLVAAKYILVDTQHIKNSRGKMGPVRVCSITPEGGEKLQDILDLKYEKRLIARLTAVMKRSAVILK